MFFCGIVSSPAFALQDEGELKTIKFPADSVQQAQASETIEKMKAQYEKERKEEELELLKKDKEIQIRELERQKAIRNYFFIGMVLVVAFAVFIFTKYRKEKAELNRLKKDHEDNQKILDSFSKK